MAFKKWDATGVCERTERRQEKRNRGYILPHRQREPKENLFSVYTKIRGLKENVF